MNVARTSAALLLTLLSGCATGSGAWVFEKPGATEAQIKRDRDQCFAQSIDAEHGNRVAIGLRIDREAYKACMEGRGYRVRVALAAEN
jgi:hypothetical protein